MIGEKNKFVFNTISVDTSIVKEEPRDTQGSQFTGKNLASQSDSAQMLPPKKLKVDKLKKKRKNKGSKSPINTAKQTVNTSHNRIPSTFQNVNVY